MNQQLEYLTELKEQLCNWKAYDETQLEELIEEFEKFPRKEYSLNYIPVLTDSSLITSVFEIGKVYQNNLKLLINVISSLGNIVCRYEVTPSSEMFIFFKECTKKKKVNYYVSLYISSFPQYSNWDDRWNSLLSMPQIAPKKKSILNFQTELKRLLVSNEPIPAEVRQQIIQTLNTIIGSGTLGEYSKSAFLQIASLLEQ